MKNKINGASNNFLVVLITATIIFSTIGTWISLSRLGPLTGLVPAPGIGLVNVTVNSTLSFSITPQSVNFSAMNPGDNNDTLDFGPLPFNVTNDGTVLINITLSESASLFEQCAQNTSCFQYACGNTSIFGNCSGKHCSNNGKLTPCVPNFWNVSTTAQQVISFLDFFGSNNTVYVHINVTVPQDEGAGGKVATLTFSALQAS